MYTYTNKQKKKKKEGQGGSVDSLDFSHKFHFSSHELIYT